jgi:hypothetical protein
MGGYDHVSTTPVGLEVDGGFVARMCLTIGLVEGPRCKTYAEGETTGGLPVPAGPDGTGGRPLPDGKGAREKLGRGAREKLGSGRGVKTGTSGSSS